jgi:pyruvate/2-oxoglutarate dehydrogenase complex dihydrolipoamide dehydrogenase (E3) component
VVERYDTLVLGGGMSGLPLALRAGRNGRVAFVEKETLGGTCLNRGCIPTKTMTASATVANQIRRASEFGVRAGAPEVDLSAVIDRKDEIVDTIRTGAYHPVERAATVDLYQGQGTSPDRTGCVSTAPTWKPSGSFWPPGCGPSFPRSRASTPSPT